MPPRRVHGVSRKRRVLQVVMIKRAFSQQRRQRKHSYAQRPRCLLSGKRGGESHFVDELDLPFSHLRKGSQRLLLSDSFGSWLFSDPRDSNLRHPLRRSTGHMAFLNDPFALDSDSSRDPVLDCGLRQDQVIDLMYRDIKPEDFELLSKLDESLPKRNVAKRNIVDSLPRVHTHDCSATECGVCLSDWSVDAHAVELPCKHCFHLTCITKWLTQCKNACPICSAPIDNSSAEHGSQS